MGWLTLRSRANNHCRDSERNPVSASISASDKTGAYSEHTENIAIEISTDTQIQPRLKVLSSSFLGQTYPLHSTKPDSELPYIDSSIVSLVEKHWNRATSGPAVEQLPVWIVIDNIVYDCTSFQHSHPGGPVVIRSFVGQDCSWQFWRFHGKKHMMKFGRPLRIGKTSGIRNRFVEPPIYVGLSSGLGDDEW